nr:exportin 5 [Hymenolepis microstoma]
MSGEVSLEQVIDYLKKIFSPTISNVERNHYYRVTESYKDALFKLEDLNTLCSPDQEPPVVIFGLNCLEHKVKRTWANLSSEEKQAVRQCVCCFVTNFENMICRNSEGNAVCLVIAQIMVHLIKCEWPQQWPNMVPELISLGQTGNLQALVVFDIFRRLSEDILFFQDVPLKRRRELSTALADNLQQISNFTLDCIYSAVKLHSSQNRDFDDDTTRCLRSGLFLLTALYEWCHLKPLFEWKPPDQMTLNTFAISPCVSLFLFLLRLPQLRTATAEFLIVILTKKQPITGGNKTNDSVPAYQHFYATNGENPIETILEISQTAFSTSDFEESTCIFMHRWSEFISRLGVLVVEDWKKFETNGSQALQAFDFLIQANVLAISHPSKLFINQVRSFFKSALSSSESLVITLLAKHMPKLLPIWMDCMVLEPFPSSNYPFSSWIHATYEKDHYSARMAEMRAFLKSNCLYLAASIWPAEVIGYLIEWHKRCLSLSPQLSDLVIPGYPFVNQSSPLVQQWEGLNFAMEKTVANACSSDDNVAIPQPPDKVALRNTLLVHLRDCFNAASSALPEDPGVREWYLGVLHTMVMACPEAAKEFSLKLLMMEFASLRYNPKAPVPAGKSILVPPPQLLNLINLRSPVVRDLHTSIGINIHRLVRLQPAAMLPYFDSFCSELSDIWTNRHGGLSEQCLLLEVVVFLALRLPCSFAEQKEKLSSILSGILSDWSNPQSFLVAFNVEENGQGTKGGLLQILEYFGFTQDIKLVKQNTDFLIEREITRLQLQWTTSATASILKRLRETLSQEQCQNVAMPLIEPLTSPAFNLLKALHNLWLPETLQKCHPSTHSLFNVNRADKLQLTKTDLKISDVKQSNENQITAYYQDLKQIYPSKLQSLLIQLYTSSLDICKSILMISTSKIYAMPTEKLGNLLCNYLCPDLLGMPDFRQLQLLRGIIIPYVEFCPTQYIETALVPLMPYVLDTLYQKVSKSWAAVKVADQDEVDDEEALEEIFTEETVRTLAAKVLDLTRILLAFTGTASRRPTESAETAVGEGIGEFEGVEMDEEAEDPQQQESSQAGSLNASFGPVAASLFLSNTSGTNGEMLLRFSSWLIAAISWPDSKVCAKAAQLLVKIIDYALRRSTPNTSLLLPPNLASELLIGGIRALQINGHNLPDVGSAVFNLIGRAMLLIEGGVEAANLHLAPILLSALNSCQRNGQNNQYVDDIRKYIQIVFNPVKPPTEKVLRDRSKSLLQPIIGVPVAEQFKESLSISTIEPLTRPSMNSKRGQRRRRSEERSQIVALALSDLFGVD